MEREPSTRGFKALPRRWVVGCSFAWLSRTRQLAKDYGRKVQTSETLIEFAAIRLLLRRLTTAGIPPRATHARFEFLTRHQVWSVI
jgi:hypothetical protein